LHCARPDSCRLTLEQLIVEQSQVFPLGVI
jgi:hypothetical protein